MQDGPIDIELGSATSLAVTRFQGCTRQLAHKKPVSKSERAITQFGLSVPNEQPEWVFAIH